MEQVMQENVTVSADEVDKVLSGVASATPEKAPAGFNYNKLTAALCMLASALVTVSLIMWAVLA